LKGSFIAPYFIHVSLSKPFVLETDAFDFALNVILSQPKEDNLPHPVGFHSYKFFPTEINYETHDKKLLAIMDAFEEWRHILEGVQHEIIVCINPKNL